MSPARRVRRATLRVSFLISVLAFFVVGGTIFLDQWIAGHASGRFILGTAMLSAGACIGLFAIIAALGSAISFVLRDEALGDTPSHEAASLRADPTVTGNVPSKGEPPTQTSLSSSTTARQRQSVDDINPWIGRTQSG